MAAGQRPTNPPDETGQRSVDENSRHSIGAAVTDPETTRLQPTPLTKSRGQLRVGSAANLDHETVVVSVSDPFNPAVTQRVTINVTDVNEAPVVSGTQYFDGE